MKFVASVIALCAMSTSALAADPFEYESDPQTLNFFDEVRVFDVLAIDTGYWPGGIASVRFFVAPTGGVSTELEATSHMHWPDPLSHMITGVPGTGYLTLDGTIDLQAELYIDLGFLYRGTIPLWTESISFFDESAFAPLLLDGSNVNVDGDSAILPELRIPITELVAGTTVVAVGSVYPSVGATMTPVKVHTETDDGTMFEQTAEPQTNVLPLPLDPTEAALRSAYTADIDSHMDMVLEVSVELDTFLGPISTFEFPLPLTLVSDSQRRTFEPINYTHPLPAVGEVPLILDFGVVAEGDSVTMDLPVDNFGTRIMGTEISVVDGSYFGVEPASALVDAGDTQTFTVTFQAHGDDTLETTLLLETTDPGYPLIEVQLIGQSEAPVEDDTDIPETDDDNPDDIVDDVDEREPDGMKSQRAEVKAEGGCSCATQTAPSLSWLGLLLVALGYRRRR